MGADGSQRILIVEDDVELAGMVADFLEGEGFEVAVEGNGFAAVERLRTNYFDAIVLDIGLPGLDGFQVCRSIRSTFAGPILMLTARGAEEDEVRALDAGADDYMTKPVRPQAMLARLKIHLRRGSPHVQAEQQEMVVGTLKIDTACREVSIEGQMIDLTTAEFDLLFLLACRVGHVVPRTEIYEQLNGIPYDGLDRSIDLRVSRLRKKLGDDPYSPALIKSVRGVGYILANR